MPFTSPVGVGKQVPLFGVTELESKTFDEAVSGPGLGVIETDVDLAEKPIRKCSEDLVLVLVSGRGIVSLSGVLRTDQIPKQAVQTWVVALSQVHQRVSFWGECLKRVVPV